MSTVKIAIIGLGYVGLPLARLFATKYTVVGFDINPQRIAELKQGNTHMIIVALKRGDVETEYPEDNTILQDQDTLIVRGKPRRVELTERFLQEGT